VLQLNDTTERRLIPIGSAWFDQTAEVIRVDGEDVDGARRSSSVPSSSG
jgi:hypothetical protein